MNKLAPNMAESHARTVEVLNGKYGSRRAVAHDVFGWFGVDAEEFEDFDGEAFYHRNIAFSAAEDGEISVAELARAIDKSGEFDDILGGSSGATHQMATNDQEIPEFLDEHRDTMQDAMVKARSVVDAQTGALNPEDVDFATEITVITLITQYAIGWIAERALAQSGQFSKGQESQDGKGMDLFISGVEGKNHIQLKSWRFNKKQDNTGNSSTLVQHKNGKSKIVNTNGVEVDVWVYGWCESTGELVIARDYKDVTDYVKAKTGEKKGDQYARLW